MAGMMVQGLVAQLDAKPVAVLADSMADSMAAM